MTLETANTLTNLYALVFTNHIFILSQKYDLFAEKMAQAIQKSEEVAVKSGIKC